MTIKTENKAMEQRAKYYVRTQSKPFNNRRLNELNTAMKQNKLLSIQITNDTKLLVNRMIKGKPGDVVMWIDDNGNDHLDKLTSSVRPANVFGKVESVITKL